MFAYEQKKTTKLKTPQPQKKDSIQRMAVHYGPKPPVDMNVVATLPNIVASVGEPVLSEKETYSYAKQKCIGILAHGDANVIYWNDSDMNGKEFAETELIHKGIEDNSTLEVWSCRAGTDEDEEGVSHSLIGDIKAKLKEAGKKNIVIKGVEGTHIVLNHDNSHYVPGEKFDEDYERERNRILTEVGFFPIGFEEDPDDYISNLQELYSYEKERRKISVNYKHYLKIKTRQWLKMCKLLKKTDGFKEMLKKVPERWKTEVVEGAKIAEPIEDVKGDKGFYKKVAPSRHSQYSVELDEEAEN